MAFQNILPSGVDHRNDAHHAHEEEAQASVSLDTPQLRQSNIFGDSQMKYENYVL
jgi:hypothetical protein